VVEGTHTQTASAMRGWFRICDDLGLDPVLRPSRTQGDRLDTIIAVAGVWAVQGNKGRGCVESTISKYLSRVYTFHRECGIPHPLADCDKLRIERLLRGIERLGAQPLHRRRAITAEIILRMLAARCCDPSRLESATLRFCLVLGFFALFRRGDMFAATAAAFNPVLDLCVGDFRLDRDGDDAALVVNLKCCKGDRAARGQDVVLGPGAEGLCVVAEYELFQPWRAEAGAQEAMFVDGQGQPMGFRQQASLMSAVISSIGEDPHAYTWHSLCSGGACAAAAAGIPEFLIQQLGRWKSLAFKVYLHHDRRLHAGTAARMARARPALPGPAWAAPRVCQLPGQGRP
jgi:hypothetical protein